MECRGAKSERSQDPLLAANQIPQLSPEQGSFFQGMLADDDPIPQQMIGILVITNQLQVQILYPPSAPGQLGQWREPLAIIGQFAGLVAGTPSLGRGQPHTSEFLQTIERDVGRTDARLSSTIEPLALPAKLLDQGMARRRVLFNRARAQLIQIPLPYPSSRDPNRVYDAAYYQRPRSVCLEQTFVGKVEGRAAAATAL